MNCKILLLLCLCIPLASHATQCPKGEEKQETKQMEVQSFVGASVNENSQHDKNKHSSDQKRIEDLINRLSIDEK